LPKKTLGINISEKEATILLKGEYLKNKTLTFKNGSKAKKNVYLKDGRVTYEKEKVDSEKIGKCPKCGKNLLKSSKAYYCESCSDFIPTSYGDKEIAHEDAKILLSGDVAELKDEKGNNLYLIKLKDKLTYVNEYMTNKEKENAEVVGKCPKCSSEVVEGSDFYICKDYPKKCDFSMKKKIKESPITNEDMKAILSGEKTSIHKFKWKNNKWGEAKLYYENGKLKFEFKQ
jgi:DNA topoisomerase-3